MIVVIKKHYVEKCHTSPTRHRIAIFVRFLVFESRHLVFDLRVLGNLGVLVLIRHSRVRDML